MKKAVKKLTLSIVILAVSLSLAITSTFAWFTMSADPEVGGFDLQVTTSDGLLVRLPTQTKFKSYITTQEIFDYLFDTDGEGPDTGLYDVDFKLNACTSENGDVIKDFSGKAPEDAGYEGQFIEFELYFFSAVGQEISLYPDDSTTYVSTKTPGEKAKAKAWEAISADTYGEEHDAIADEADIPAEAQNAVRISFDDGITSPIWNPNPHLGYNYDVNYMGLLEGYTEMNLALDYYNEINGTELETPAYYGGENINFSTNYSEEVDGYYVIDDTLLTISAGVEGMLTIRIWLEGWDGDCFDSIFDDIFTVALQFKGTEIV